MAEDRLVDFVDADLVARLGERVRAHHDVDVPSLVTKATKGWPDRLVPRLDHVADVLQGLLPDDPLPIIRRVVDDLPDDAAADLGFDVWPLIEIVGRQTDHADEALATLRELGAKTYPELGIRPLLQLDLHRTLTVLRSWTADPRPGVRRVASEGSRPRLPWAPVLRALVDDPTPTLPILEALRDDEDHLVRNSVANHLNDISKDHPDLVLDVVRRWLTAPTPHREWIATRALRTLTKRGHPGALDVLGLGPVAVEVARFIVDPPSATIGDTVTMTVSLTNAESRPRTLAVEAAIHYPRANGATSRKVFTWWQGELDPGQRWSGSRRQHFRDLSTRVHHPGPHAVELLVNGQVAATTTVALHATDSHP